MHPIGIEESATLGIRNSLVSYITKSNYAKHCQALNQILSSSHGLSSMAKVSFGTGVI